MNPASASEPTTASTAAVSVDSSLATKLLPGVLSIVAGSVDVISFLGLGGLFAAHITGNLVVLVAHVVTGRAVSLASILAVPVFVVVLGLTRLAAAGLEETGRCPPGGRSDAPAPPCPSLPLLTAPAPVIRPGGRPRPRPPGRGAV